MSNRQILTLPKHQNPSHNRTASAPYNFTPLPETVVTAVENANDLPDHDRYYTDRHTGYFEVTLTTKSPVYVRCPFTLQEFLRQERGEDADEPFRQQVRNTPDFFYTCDCSRPVIPGSSLRGMLRNVLEIVSYGKVQWVTEKNLFFRTVDNTAVGRHYRGRMTGRVEAGFLRREGDGYVIKVCQMARVQRSRLGGSLYEGEAPNKTPRWNGRPHQWIPVWVRLSNNGRSVEEIGYERHAAWSEGRLVITGDIPGKRKEFVFLLPGQDAEEIPVPEELIERFHDDDQITQWQERAFPKDQPNLNCRDRDGLLRRNPPEPGDPVFFLRENGQLTFFGRAQMFRLPYERRPLDLVPPELRRPEDIDYAEALFGFVRTGKELEDIKQRRVISEVPKQGDKRRAYAGRVFVTDAALEEGQSDYWLSNEPIIPKILATPKPTAFQHYLVQTNDNKNTLKHYGSSTPQETVIRGHKRYWHQGLGTENGRSLDEIRAMIEEERERLRQLSEHDTQHTQFKPVRPGVKFTFRVYFENLSDRELGALCWTLHPLGDPNKEYCHHLGMGKPLGMGAVKLEATLHLTNRLTRYGSLLEGENWQTGATGVGESLCERATLEQRTRAFEEHILEALGLSTRCRHLSQVKRIGMLLKIMEWPGFRAVPPVFGQPAPNNCVVTDSGRQRPNTRYMMIELPGVSSPAKNEYRHRPVLPDPCAFDPSLCHLAEPAPDASGAPASASPQSGAPDHPTSSPSGSSMTIPQKSSRKPQKQKSEEAKAITKREWVTLIEEVEGGQAKVRTEDGEIIVCRNFPPYPKGAVEARCRADVTREDGKARRAVFKGWK